MRPENGGDFLKSTSAVADVMPTPSQPLEPKDITIMPMTGHLQELRYRLMVSLGILTLGVAVAFFYAKPMLQWLEVLAPQGTLFVQLSPGETFFAACKLAFFAGLGLALPVLFYQLFRFVSPGLKPREKQAVLPMILLGMILFAGGVCFGYTLVLPLMIDFLVGYGQDVVQNQLSIGAFVNFCLGFLFASGIMFQIPLMILCLGFIGLINSQKLLAQWKGACVVSFLVGAMITPAVDPFSQSVMSLALIGLYGLSFGLLKLLGK